MTMISIALKKKAKAKESFSVASAPILNPLQLNRNLNFYQFAYVCSPGSRRFTPRNVNSAARNPTIAMIAAFRPLYPTVRR